jgi:2,3-bisphosphoglycerate-independent phosphoglycerate mutase
MKKGNKHPQESSFVGAIRKAYQRGEEDEALEPIVAVDASSRAQGRFEDGDYVIFYDIRGEREVEITESFTNRDFKHFPTKRNFSVNFVTMIEYNSSLPVKVAFPPDDEIKNTLFEVLSKASTKVLKIAESEKAIHVGYFMNGKREGEFPGEERIIIPSPGGVASYSQTPEMSAPQVAQEVCAQIANSGQGEVIVANLANVDVVGHIEDKKAVLEAIEAVDRALGEIAEVCRSFEKTLVVTADHGTVEEWHYPDGAINTGHTRNPVPFIIADFSQKKRGEKKIKKKGELVDVAPTLLDLLGLDKPTEMTGSSLILDSAPRRKKSGGILLLILDGWGISKKKKGNLIEEAHTPHFDQLWSSFPHSVLRAAGEAVGMPAHTVGNSEAGHLHIGAGRRIFLDRVRIDKSIQDGSFQSNPAFLWAMENAKKEQKSLHLLGIVSHYSSHGTIKHLFALLELAKKRKLEQVFVHALIGRRGEKPESGAVYIGKVEEMCRAFSVGRIVTVIGRFWALDREENWDRIEKTYRALVYGEGTPVVVD